MPRLARDKAGKILLWPALEQKACASANPATTHFLAVDPFTRKLVEVEPPKLKAKNQSPCLTFLRDLTRPYMSRPEFERLLKEKKPPLWMSQLEGSTTAVIVSSVWLAPSSSGKLPLRVDLDMVDPKDREALQRLLPKWDPAPKTQAKGVSLQAIEALADRVIPLAGVDPDVPVQTVLNLTKKVLRAIDKATVGVDADANRAHREYLRFRFVDFLRVVSTRKPKQELGPKNATALDKIAQDTLERKMDVAFGSAWKTAQVDSRAPAYEPNEPDSEEYDPDDSDAVKSRLKQLELEAQSRSRDVWPPPEWKEKC